MISGGQIVVARVNPDQGPEVRQKKGLADLEVEAGALHGPAEVQNAANRKVGLDHPVAAVHVARDHAAVADQVHHVTLTVQVVLRGDLARYRFLDVTGLLVFCLGEELPDTSRRAISRVFIFQLIVYLWSAI